MATGTAGSSARRNTTQQVGYLRKGFTFANATETLTLGVLPAGAIVINAGVVVSEAFNAGTNNRLDIGTSGDTDGFATDLALGTVGLIVWDELATSSDVGPYASDTTIQCVVDVTGTAATTGIGTVFVTYIPNNDG
jgi:hypothetical protein